MLMLLLLLFLDVIVAFGAIHAVVGVGSDAAVAGVVAAIVAVAAGPV